MEKQKAAAALIATLFNSVQALGRGFDVTADTRLLYCKGAPGSRLVEIYEGRARDFAVNEPGVVLKDVPADVEISRERRVRETTPVCSFHEVFKTGTEDGRWMAVPWDFWLSINSSSLEQMQISVGRKPVTGLRLCVEGSKLNRLAIHLQHLASLPKILRPHWDSRIAIGAPKWQGPEEQDSRWFEPIKWKNFAHVSTAPIENAETNIGDLSGVYIVTGAQLGVWDFGAKSVFTLKFCSQRSLDAPSGDRCGIHGPSASLPQRPDEPSSSSGDNLASLESLQRSWIQQHRILLGIG